MLKKKKKESSTSFFVPQKPTKNKRYLSQVSVEPTKEPHTYTHNTTISLLPNN